METRTNDSLNRLMQVGGAGSTVVEGRGNEFASVTVAARPPGTRGTMDGLTIVLLPNPV